MKKFKACISLLLVVIMILSAFVSCTDENGVLGTESTIAESESGTSSDNENTTKEDTQTSTVESIGKNDDTTADTDTSSGEESTQNGTETTAPEGGETTAPEGGETTEGTELKGTNEELINNAQNLAGAVNSYFEDVNRKHFVMTNSNVVMRYALKAQDFQGFSSISNKNGATYIQDTMVAYVAKKDGSVHYSSYSTAETQSNIYRFGYYYYENRLEYEVLMNTDAPAESETKVALKSFHSPVDIANSYKDGILTLKLRKNNADYKIYSTVDAADCDFLKITIKATISENSNTSFQIFYTYDSEGKYDAKVVSNIDLINDGEYHTYYVDLSSLPGFEGNIYSMRLDPNGGVISDQ